MTLFQPDSDVTIEEDYLGTQPNMPAAMDHQALNHPYRRSRDKSGVLNERQPGDTSRELLSMIPHRAALAAFVLSIT
jgi:hypothetical protein